MAKYKDISGEKFGKLAAISYSHSDGHGHAIWLVQCDCGKEFLIKQNSLQSGNSKSCGCSRVEFIRRGIQKHGFASFKKEQRFYRIYRKIVARCGDNSQHLFERYGGRGIKCLWESFEQFRDDMYESYLAHVSKYGEKNTLIDRINNDGNYCKENCKWNTYRDQSRNTSRNRVLTFRGVSMCLQDWSLRAGINNSTLTGRLNRGWSVEKSLTIPVR